MKELRFKELTMGPNGHRRELVGLTEDGIAYSLNETTDKWIRLPMFTKEEE